MSSTFFLGERDGGRVLAFGDASTQVGGDFQVDFTTWDLIPAGEVGDVLFRSIDVAFNAESGYKIGVTPIVDGIPLIEQTFSGPTTGEAQAQALFATRGTRCSARIRTLSRSGGITWHNVKLAHVNIRMVP